MKIFQVISAVKHKFLKTSFWKKIIILLLSGSLGGFITFKIKISQNAKPLYQTAQAEKGTLVVSVSGSGNVSTTNSASVSTQATGVISEVFVKDGDQVKTGDKIAEIELDLQGIQRTFKSLANYQNAKNTLNTARANLYTTQSDMFTNWDMFYELATNSTYQNADGTPTCKNLDWEVVCTTLE